MKRVKGWPPFLPSGSLPQASCTAAASPVKHSTGLDNTLALYEKAGHHSSPAAFFPQFAAQQHRPGQAQGGAE